MATDLYARCPCGSGKKIKFCCKDIITDLEKIDRMLQGEQRTSALDRINKLLVQHPKRPALLSLKAQVLLDLQNPEEAAEVIANILEVEPDNSPALAMKATLLSSQGLIQEALANLHRASRTSNGVMSQVLFQSYLTLCMVLIQTGELIVAYAHLLTLVSITKGQDNVSVSMLMKVTSSERLPAVFHGLMIAHDAPDGAMWKREFDAAIDVYRHGDWSEAASLLEDMSNRVLDEPVILRNLGILQAWTGRYEKAVKSFRYYAAIRGIDEMAAVEAEACAQVLESNADDADELVSLTHEVDDAQALMEKLLSDEKIDSIPVTPTPESDEPPPKGQFLLFDRAVPKADAEPTGELPDIAELAHEICSLTLFGKETDRSARIVIGTFKDERLSQVIQQVSEITGENIPSDAELQSVAPVNRVERLFRPNFRLPQGTPIESIRTMQGKWIVQQLQEKWPQLQLSQFDGKSAADAAGEKKFKRKVLAAILNLELWSDRQPFDFDFDTLREKLGLPQVESINPEGVDIRALTSTQIRYLQLDKLSDEDLKFVFEVVSIRPNGSLLYRIGEEILKRPEMGNQVELIEVHERMAELAPTSDLQLQHIATARDTAVSQGESPAPWLITELDLRIQRGEIDVVKRLLAEIQSRYIREPGVAQSLAGVLNRYGMLAGAAPAPATPVGAPGEPVPAAVGASASSEGLWTPDSPDANAPTASDEEGKSKLWVPGMD